MLLTKIFFFILLVAFAVLFFIVGYKMRRGEWLKLLAGNWEQDIPLKKAQRIGKSIGIIMYICTIFFIVIAIYIMI